MRCNANPGTTYATNLDGAVRLAAHQNEGDIYDDDQNQGKESYLLSHHMAQARARKAWVTGNLVPHVDSDSSERLTQAV